MTLEDDIQNIQSELEAGLTLAKCQKCGCMESTINNLTSALATQDTPSTQILANRLSEFHKTMLPVQYSCLGCQHCYPAEAQNIFIHAFPSLSSEAVDLSCNFNIREKVWPPIVGEYFVVNTSGPIAVSTLGSAQLAGDIAQRKPNGLAIVGKTETENIGLDKVIKNIITSSTLRYLLLVGKDPLGHLPGQTLLALGSNGIDDKRRVIGSQGKRPILRNVTAAEVQAFRDQVQIVDMIGCEDPDEIQAWVEKLTEQTPIPCGCSECNNKSSLAVSTPDILIAAEQTDPVKMDPAGYFVITPRPDKGMINVEYYSYNNSLIQTIEGVTARALYTEIISRGWVTEMSHAAYLGKELAKAELSLQYGLRYLQDGA